MPRQTNSSTTEDFAPPANNGESDRFGKSEPSAPTPDPLAAFDPAKLRIDQSFLQHGAAKKRLTTIPIRKPGKQDFVRVHPDEQYRLPVALIELEEDRETYLVMPDFVPCLGEGEYFTATLYLCINRQKVLTFWPVKLPGPDGRQMAWHTSAAEAAEMAMETWVRVTAKKSLGAYEIFEATGTIPEPEWPEQSMRELLAIGFKARIIDGPEHPVIQKLRGEI